MKRLTKFIWVLCVAALTLWTSAVTQAAPGISFLTSGYEDGGGYSLGYDFTPTTALSVTDLGFFDNGGDGLLFNHDVGIYRVSDQQLVASATVLTTDTLLINRYWYHDIPDVTLDAGVTYRAVAVTVSGEGWAKNPYDGKPETDPTSVADFGRSVLRWIEWPAHVSDHPRLRLVWRAQFSRYRPHPGTERGVAGIGRAVADSTQAAGGSL